MFFFIPGTSYKFDKSIFKMVVVKSILEIVKSPLLRPSYFIHNLLALVLASVIFLTVCKRWQDCLIKYLIYTMGEPYCTYPL